MNINTSLDSLKRLALKQILDNAGSDIKSEHIINYLNKYIKYGSESSLILTDIAKPDVRNIFISDLSAKVLLAYLELYTSYIIASSNSEIIDKLNIVSLSKYSYILFKYKEASSLVEEKKILKTYKYVRHINFSSPKYISALNNNFNTLQLSYKNLLSLPILNNKIVYPDDIMVYINDSALSTLSYQSDNKNISASIFRKFGSHIGSVKETKVLTATACSGDITFDGIFTGFISNIIYFYIEAVDSNTNSIIYKTSINGQDWTYISPSIAVYTNNEYNIYILNEVKSGATFKVTNTANLVSGSMWGLIVDYKHLNYPICNMKLIFNILNPLSYITYNDISEYDLGISGYAEIKREETGQSTYFEIQQNSIENIVPINGIAYSADISSTQSKYKLHCGTNGELLLKYDYDIADITGNSNVYYNTGSILFDKLSVENISTVSLEASEFIQQPRSGEDISRSCIFYSMITETDFGISEIPLLKMNNSLLESGKYYTIEPIIFNDRTINTSNNMQYSMKHKFLNQDNTKLYVFSNTCSAYNFNNPKFSIVSHASSGNLINSNIIMTIDTANDIGTHYIYKSNIFMGDISSINSIGITGSHNWTITNNKTAYMFYKDVDDQIKLAIKLLSSIDGASAALTQFTGDISGKVTMLSSDESYISPYLTSYTLSCI